MNIQTIAKYAMSPEEYWEGKKIASQGAVSIEKEDHFWRDEYNLTATVRDGETLRTVVLSMGQESIKSYRCDCQKTLAGEPENSLGRSVKGLCRHGVAVALVYAARASREPTTPVVTSPAARKLLEQYERQDQAIKMQLNGCGPVRLQPHLHLYREGVRISFLIGREKLYLLRDLRAFAQAMENGSVVEYGKNLCFLHMREAFSDESAELADMICSMIFKEERSRGWGRSEKVRELELDPYMTDRVIQGLEGSLVQVSLPQGDEKRVPVVRMDPRLQIFIGKKGENGMTISASGLIWAMKGRRRGYVCDGSRIYICSEKFTQRALLFLTQMIRQVSGAALDFQKKDFAVFCRRILPGLEEVLEIQSQDLELSRYRPLPLRTEFYLDLPDRDCVTCEVKQYYGDRVFHPVSADLPEDFYRDLEGEQQVRTVLSRYFSYRDQQGRLLIKGDPDAVYRLLREGMPELMACGIVYASDGFYRQKIRKAPGLRAKAGISGGLLNLSLDLEGVEPGELAGILESYRRKRNYHRLKNGDFVSLEDPGDLAMLEDLTEGVGLTDRQLGQKEILLNRYWTLYLDQRLGQKKNQHFQRDQAFQKIGRDLEEGRCDTAVISDQLKQVLRPYQQEGCKWLHMLDHYGFGGILADDMGLGKSLQIISILGEGTALIVCPASLVYNWQNEFEKFAPWLRVLPVVGEVWEREKLLSDWQSWDVLITSYDLLRRDGALYQGKHFRYQIIDEAQYIKNHQTQNAKAVKEISADTRYALTGTPIENRLGELWSIFDYLMPGFLGNASRFRKHFELPIQKDGDPATASRLRSLTGPFILRRKKRDVLKELPKKLENILYSRLEGEQKRLYQAAALHLKEQLEGVSEKALADERFQVLRELTRLRQICCHPSLCFENYQGDSAKLETCMELVESSVDAGHKILLFSQFTSMLERIGERLQAAGISYHMLTGTVSKEKRMVMVQEFEHDQVPVFLISLKAGGTGLNLTAADVVIHYDPWWNQAAENQATDRTHRIGQDKVVSVYKLIAKNTLEERIIELQQKKKALADEILAENQGSLWSLGKEELMELLRGDM